ncbi:MAG: trehalose-phosphatase [Flavitalea sp.]
MASAIKSYLSNAGSMQSRIKQYEISVWAEDFLHQLNTIKKRQLKFQVRFIEDSTKRLLLLDYDGTLVSFSALPADAVPDSRLIDLLKRLCDKESNEVFKNRIPCFLCHL